MHNTISTAAALAPVLPADDLALVSIRLLVPIVGLKKSALYARIQAGRFPAPLRLSARCSRFRVGSVRAYLRDPLGWSADKANDTLQLEGAGA